jgi:hypothetical protein
MSGSRRFDTEKPHSPAFGFAPRPGGAFVADLAARAGRCAGERRDRGRMVVRLDLEDRVRQLVARGVVDCHRTRRMVAARVEALHHAAFDHRRIVGVRDDGALRGRLVGRLDHAEQRLAACLAVDRPARVEDLVPAVLGVGLREHHQLDVGRVAFELRESVDEVVDLVVRQRETHLGVRARERRASFRAQPDRHHRLAGQLDEQPRGIRGRIDDALGHPVVQHARDRVGLARGEPGACRTAVPSSPR